MLSYKSLLNYLKSYKLSDISYGYGNKRARLLLELLGNPQEKLKVIHVVGTSGKSSTAFYLSHLLHAHRFTVGLEISPVLFDLRERFQINNTFIPRNAFVGLFTEILPAIEKVSVSRYGRLDVYEILFAFSYYVFWRYKVDYAIIEAGIGGKHDPTNVVARRDQMIVVTPIGYDHQKILGDTLPEIAVQKAGIFHDGNIVITASQSPEVYKILIDQCMKNNSPIISYNKSFYNSINTVSNSGTTFDFSYNSLKFPNLHLRMIGRHQADNCSLALAALIKLSKKNKFTLSKKKIYATLDDILLLGRIDILKRGKRRIILDGAHNYQKLCALKHSMKHIAPDKKYIIIVSFSESKDYKNNLSTMIQILLPMADQIIIVDKLPYNKMVPVQRIRSVLKSLNFNKYKHVSIEEAIDISLTSSQSAVYTGSLYLLSEVYKLLHLKGF